MNETASRRSFALRFFLHGVETNNALGVGLCDEELNFFQTFVFVMYRAGKISFCCRNTILALNCVAIIIISVAV